MIGKYKEAKRHLKVRKSKTGLGLFALESIERKGLVIEYVGPILTRKEANEKGGQYLFETSYNRFIDGSGRKNTARYINHSCNPNCEIDIVGGRVLVITKREILAGEELNYDYGEEFFDEHIKPYGCKCPSCFPPKRKDKSV
jgi:uncharacterized protein